MKERLHEYPGKAEAQLAAVARSASRSGDRAGDRIARRHRALVNAGLFAQSP